MRGTKEKRAEVNEENCNTRSNYSQHHTICSILYFTHLICSLVDSESTGNLGGSSSVHNAVVSDQIADYTQSIMEGPLGLFNDLFVIETK